MDDATELAVRRARDQYPHGDAELAAELGAGSPDTVARVMQRTHEAAVQARQQGQAPAGPTAVGVPVPSDNATRVAESEEVRRIREGQYKVRQRPGRTPGKNRTLVEPWEAEELRDQFFRMSWNAHQAARARAGGNEEAARRASNVSAPPTLPLPGASF